MQDCKKVDILCEYASSSFACIQQSYMSTTLYILTRCTKERVASVLISSQQAHTRQGLHQAMSWAGRYQEDVKQVRAGRLQLMCIV